MNKVKYIITALLGVLFAACSEEENVSQAGKSGFQVSLAESVRVESRRTPEEIGKPAVSNFKLKITRQPDGLEAYNGSYTANPIPAPVGTYTLEAEQGDNPVLALDAPYYKGTAEAEVVSETESTPVTIQCMVANALASVVFDDSGAYKFDDQFSSYEVRVAFPSISTVLRNDGKSAYYRAGTKPVFTFEGTLEDGTHIEPVPLTDEKLSDNTTFAAGQHCIIKLRLGATSSGVRVEVSKVEVKPVTINETIPLEWLPKPKVEAEGFDANNTLTFVETEQKQAALNLNLSSALQDMKFKFNFEDKQFATSLQADKEYLLSNAEDKKAIETALGITLPNVGDKPESIDLSNLLAKLQTNAGTSTTNTIEIDVQANNRWSSEDAEANRTYKVVCNKPEFSVDAYPGNIWTKEFTVNALREEQVTSGDFTTLSSDMTYQYSVDGETNWITLNDGMRQDQLISGTTYYIRGLYRGEVAGKVAEVSTYPVIELENGNMEKWKEEERGYYYDGNIFNSNDPKLRVYYPWDDESFWNTNNDFTTRNRDASTAAFSIVYRYNSFPAVSYTKDANSGTWAAELRNTAAGRGNTSSSESSYDFNNVPGELFIGDISVSESGTEVIPNDSYSINKGKTFASRPTALRFYYKYAPYNTDSWKVYIALYDSEDNIIAENTKTGDKQDSYNFIDVPFNYTDDLNAVPAKIYVYFASSIYSGNQLPYHKMNVTTWYKDSQRTDETLSGSVFIIDDISLIYDK